MEASGKYLKLYEKTRDDIINGVYAKGTRLPSKRVMAEANGVSVITVMHAYELLSEEGYIVSKEKSGFFVTYDSESGFDNPSGFKLESLRKTVNPMDADRDEDAFSFSIYAKTVRRVLTDYAEEITEKSPFEGVYGLRQAISRYLLRSRHMEVAPEQIIVGAGAEYLYGLIVETFGREKCYGIESPSYNKIESVYKAGGAKIDLLNLGEDGILSKELERSEANILHVSPYRSFPSNVSASASKKREYLRFATSRNALVIEDDFESEFSPSRKAEETIFSLDKGERVIFINSFSQTIGSHLRTAYMVVPKALTKEFLSRVGFYACPVPTLEQLVIAEIINNGDFERHINKVRRNKRKK